MYVEFSFVELPCQYLWVIFFDSGSINKLNCLQKDPGTMWLLVHLWIRPWTGYRNYRGFNTIQVKVTQIKNQNGAFRNSFPTQYWTSLHPAVKSWGNWLPFVSNQHYKIAGKSIKRSSNNYWLTNDCPVLSNSIYFFLLSPFT